MWKYVALVFLLGGAALAQQGDCPDCGDPDRPWMRCSPESGDTSGCPEKSCASPWMVERLRQEHPDRRILDCACQHTCDPDNEHAEVTGDRGWDYKCAARCSPSNCACAHPCDG